MCKYKTEYNNNMFTKNTNLHGNVEKEWQKELIVDSERNKFTLIKLRGCLSHDYAQANSPN